LWLNFAQQTICCDSLDCNIRKATRLTAERELAIVLCLTQEMQQTAGKIYGALMANLTKRVPENVLGDFFVDSTCIDCDACRQIAPAVFSQATATSYVSHQPETPDDHTPASGSIHLDRHHGEVWL
jgi:hypothetical protein